MDSSGAHVLVCDKCFAEVEEIFRGDKAQSTGGPDAITAKYKHKKAGGNYCNRFNMTDEQVREK